MTAKSKTTTDSKKSDKTSSKSEAPKAEAAKLDAPAAAADTGGDSNGSTKKSSTPSRPISYFSSVSTDDYRTGWDGVFGRAGEKPARKPAKPVAKRKKVLPATIVLDSDDLDQATREQIDGLLRRHAKKKRLNYDKLSEKGQVSWHLTCNISDI
ncbi:MAG: hypothetical protein QGG19_02265 [Alphaproteobacteria bacterium]|jgi:hypothetical protein|nr:hypothetical protein [Rhodospirillaceae bacterium]MDP6020124.1 hypothetical protein [Alphaproteobacteria bacterium]MDP6253511.1 hypothetical protein [Alphaproteobacteria bacterium]MDP7055988.1 hypothetical protein [Alphaproteobacteria bacterium]MDP7229218.1 hypothetical protein [Alphaproteobacteria bacterium]|tara:strand:- start:3320 stop:3781 length:462 start_codon:yes stop_codon:yes gene_type:complete